MRLALLVGAVVTLAVGPREQSFRLFLTFVVVLIPRALDVPRPFDLAFIAAMSFQAWGNVFGAFDDVYGYDKLVHFLLPAAMSALFYLALVRLRVVPDLAAETGIHERGGSLLLTCVFGLALGGGLYELYEWFADTYLGAQLYTSYGDSIGDLVDDGLGALCGGALILAWNSYGWGTRRRAHAGHAPSEDPVAEAGQQVIDRLKPGPGETGGRVSYPRLPRWLAGDWSRMLRDPADLLRLGLAAGIVIAALNGETDLAIRFAISFAAAVLVRVLEVPRAFDLIFALAMVVHASGATFAAIGSMSAYEPAIHVVVSATTIPVVYVALVRLRLVPDLSAEMRLHESLAIGLIGFCSGFAVGIGYEVYVFVANRAFGAASSVQYAQLIDRLALDALGALAGALMLVIWDRRGWPTNRVPAHRLHES